MSTMSQTRHSEAGIVSIMVTMITIIVISLIVLGFADIARNEVRNSLDDQLSTQAFYAAESGVNDARAALIALLAAGTPIADKTLCGPQGDYNFTNVIDASHDVSYPCLLINASPAAVSYNVGYTSTVIPMLSNGPAFGELTLTWKPASGTSGNLANCYPNWGKLGQFLVAGGPGQWNCDYPLLRVDVLDANGSLVRANWNANTATVFFVPEDSNSVANNAGLNDRGTVVGARCTAPANTCVATISGLGGTKYYMRVTTLYRTNSLLTVTANGAKFTGSQAVIDATGKAQDVLRRILVAVDLTDANSRKIPSDALIVEDSICKRFGITDKSFDVYQTYGGGAEGNPLCIQASVGSPVP